MTAGHGAIVLIPDRCTSCLLCARECPDWCIHIEAHRETVPPAGPGGRPRTSNVLDRFAIDWALCMYCGICVDVCPYDALAWSPDPVPAEAGAADLLHERERLAGNSPH